ncbi:transmembrane protein 160 isoform 3-T3 [Sarcoramphus papa]
MGERAEEEAGPGGGAGRSGRAEPLPALPPPPPHLRPRGEPPPCPPPLPGDTGGSAPPHKVAFYGLLSWFRNGLLATGVGVISYVQSDTGRDAAYGFFILGGLCVSYGAGSYLVNLVLLRRPMMLPAPTAAANAAAAALLALLWLCALSLYVGRLEVEIVPEEPPEK